MADAIDFADVNEDHEEELTTMFLGRMQDGGTVRDPRKWTGEDRRFALYWYWLHTTNDHEIALSYECLHCGGTHIYIQNLKELADKYTPINGAAQREGKWKDEKITVRPLTGRDMEALEKMRLGMIATDGAAQKRERALMRFERLLRCVSFGEKDADSKRKRLLAMSLDAFTELSGLVYGLLAEMEHGLESEYGAGRSYLLMPPHTCPEKGEQTRLRYLFRSIDYIPDL